jgi:hypothetical protein
MAKLQILIVAVLLTVSVAKTKANVENGQWQQNPDAEMKLWKCVKKWSDYCLNKYGCHNKQGCLQNINSNVQKCVEFYNERCFMAQPGYSPCNDNIWIQPASSTPGPATTIPVRPTIQAADIPCPNGFYGDSCEKHFCDFLNPCANGGTCQKVSGELPFKCSCSNGFLGTSCELHFCDSNPCENGGTCQKDSGTCSCPKRFVGNLCETDRCDFDVSLILDPLCA